MDASMNMPKILGFRSDELAIFFQKEAQQRIARLLDSGHAVYSSGVGQDADRLLVHTADGRRRAYRIAPDGQRQESDDVA